MYGVLGYCSVLTDMEFSERVQHFCGSAMFDMHTPDVPCWVRLLKRGFALPVSTVAQQGDNQHPVIFVNHPVIGCISVLAAIHCCLHPDCVSLTS
jgi:hypothetical protein